MINECFQPQMHRDKLSVPSLKGKVNLCASVLICGSIFTKFNFWRFICSRYFVCRYAEAQLQTNSEIQVLCKLKMQQLILVLPQSAAQVLAISSNSQRL